VQQLAAAIGVSGSPFTVSGLTNFDGERETGNGLSKLPHSRFGRCSGCSSTNEIGAKFLFA
jgi:hypothetical protein